jgi:hypothetical protein
LDNKLVEIEEGLGIYADNSLVDLELDKFLDKDFTLGSIEKYKDELRKSKDVIKLKNSTEKLDTSNDCIKIKDLQEKIDNLNLKTKKYQNNSEIESNI